MYSLNKVANNPEYRIDYCVDTSRTSCQGTGALQLRGDQNSTVALCHPVVRAD